MENTNNKWYMSSTGDGSLSLTLKGALVGFVPVLMIALKVAGVDIAETEVVSVIDNLFTGVSALLMALGLLRKLYNRVI